MDNIITEVSFPQVVFSQPISLKKFTRIPFSSNSPLGDYTLLLYFFFFFCPELLIKVLCKSSYGDLDSFHFLSQCHTITEHFLLEGLSGILSVEHSAQNMVNISRPGYFSQMGLKDLHQQRLTNLFGTVPQLDCLHGAIFFSLYLV